MAKHEQNKDFTGFKVNLNEEKYKTSGEIVIEGTFSIFVNGGSQYAVWYRFPENFTYTLQDLDSGRVFHSIEGITSVSHFGTDVFEEYSKLPCDRIVTKEFSVELKNISFPDAPPEIITNYQIVIHYLEFDSAPILINNKPVQLRR